jgi:hypothetical protein
VATITWARCGAEEEALLRSLAQLAHVGLPVAVADRGTSASFSEAIGRLPGFRVTVPPMPGLVAQVQAGFELAATFGTPFILYVEPDKEEFFAARLLEFIRHAPCQEDVGVVLACRSRAALATFPPMQRYTEGVFNHLCGEVVGTPGDYSYGPFVMNRSLLPHIVKLNRALGWGWRPATFVAT